MDTSDQCQSISMPAHHLLPSGANHRVNPDPAGTASPARSRNPAADLSFLRLTGWPEAAQELVPHGREDGRPVGVGTVEFDRVTKVPRPDDKALVDDMRPFALKDIVELPDGRVIAAVGDRLDADLLIGRVGLRSVRGLLPPVGELIGLWMRGPGDHHHEPPVRASELDLGSGPGTHLPAGRQLDGEAARVLVAGPGESGWLRWAHRRGSGRLPCRGPCCLRRRGLASRHSRGAARRPAAEGPGGPAVARCETRATAVTATAAPSTCGRCTTRCQSDSVWRSC